MELVSVNPQFKYREFQQSDLPVVRQLFGETHVDAMKELDPMRQQMVRMAIAGEMGSRLTDVQSYYATGGNRFIVISPVDEPEVVAGYCALMRHDSETVELKNVVVHPNFQGQRLGTMLMDAVEHYARLDGYAKIVLWTYKYLEAATIMYYRRGYVLKEWFDFNDDVFMELEPIYMELELNECTQ